jgi:hypothetical protein
MRIERRVIGNVVVERYDFRAPPPRDERAQEEFELQMRCRLCGALNEQHPGGVYCPFTVTALDPEAFGGSDY